MNLAFGTSFSELTTASTVRSFGQFASYNFRHNTNMTKLTNTDCLLGIALNVHFLTVKEYSTTTTLGLMHRSATMGEISRGG